MLSVCAKKKLVLRRYTEKLAKLANAKLPFYRNFSASVSSFR